ncbi:O-methyltransferase [Desertibacillus haloalkaliphilus]|uniref:O-methyltransferase n=1 Tax=Desertibacillus haloalkaliphilus TaxID=1328930 RepID=UPI001C25FDB4|nr:O-methyltransferase [Desertibacillus haloalkaliphilus]MBU8905541.1 O-methyltransferase [Desertibacillus haloalkaliphilus]
MISKEINDYLESLIKPRNELISEIEQYASIHDVPIMELVGIETMLQLLNVQKPKKIVEIGTAIGYSAIRMAQQLPDSQIVTIERDPERYEKALEFIERAGVSDQIKVIFGDALEVVQEIEKLGPFDVLFIDAAKGQYQRFFEHYGALVNEQGMILSDNVLFKGLVANQNAEPKRLKTLVKKLQQYNEWITAHPEYETTILPIGDGIAVSVKRKK